MSDTYIGSFGRILPISGRPTEPSPSEKPSRTIVSTAPRLPLPTKSNFGSDPGHYEPGSSAKKTLPGTRPNSHEKLPSLNQLLTPGFTGTGSPFSFKKTKLESHQRSDIGHLKSTFTSLPVSQSRYDSIPAPSSSPYEHSYQDPSHGYSYMSTDARRPASNPTKPVLKVVGEQNIQGEGICYLYEDGSHVKKYIDGETVNAQWGVTKAGKPRKRLAIACINCREKKIRCDPGEPKCVQCDRSGRECRFQTARAHRRHDAGDGEIPPGTLGAPEVVQSAPLTTLYQAQGAGVISRAEPKLSSPFKVERESSKEPALLSTSRTKSLIKSPITGHKPWILQKVPEHPSRLTAMGSNLGVATPGQIAPNPSLTSVLSEFALRGQSLVPSMVSSKTLSDSEGELSFINTSVSLSSEDPFTEWPYEKTGQFIKELSQRLIRRAIFSMPSDTLRSCGQNQENPNTLGSLRPFEELNHPSTSKRSRQGGDDGDETADDDEGERAPACKRKRGDNAKLVKLFACPYFKFDGERYSERNITEKHYRKCASSVLRDISRLKQHLKRTHKRPDFYCGRCSQKFKERDHLNEHTRTNPPCENSAPKYGEMMTDRQHQEIKRHIGRQDQCESWYKIFHILFPDAPKPITPYMTNADPVVLHHFVEFFRGYGPEEFFGLLRDFRERSTRTIEIRPPTQTIIDEAFEITLPGYLERLAQRGQTHRAGEELTTPPSSQGDELENPNLENPLLPINPINNNTAASDVDRIAGLGLEEWPFDPADVDQAFEFYGSLSDPPVLSIYPENPQVLDM